jgi:signal transduction histidine kinase
MPPSPASRSVKGVFRPLKTYQHVVDASLALVLLVVTLPWTLSPGSVAFPSGASSFEAVTALPIAVVLCAALAIRRWSPPLALAIAWVAALAQMAVGLPPLPVDVAVFGVLYVTAAYGDRATMWLGLASSFLGAAFISVYIVALPLLRAGWAPGDALRQLAGAGVALYIAAAFALLLAWTAGALVRSVLRTRATRIAQVEAEAEAAAEQERVRIARDMHDVVAHSLAVVIAQADGARYAAASDPSAATAALGTISSTARAALADVRVLLTQLRHSQAEGPQPTLNDLEGLYAQVRAAGVDLRVDVDPAPRAEPPGGVQLAVYRVLQEALTNALRHGDGGPVSVRLAWAADRVELDVRNGMAASAPVGAGHGVIGMRERAQLVGGTLAAEAEGGEFVVRATLPIAAGDGVEVFA